MILRRHAGGYNFMGDSSTGTTLRWGRIPAEDPVQAPWPELADISISNYCTKGCGFCYRNSTPQGAVMSVEDYVYVLDSLIHPVHGRVFQVALGGGEPLEHPDFLRILDETTARGIVANFTTSGNGLTKAMAASLSGRIGAVALSVNRLAEIPMAKLRLLAEHGVKANLHFVLDAKSLHDATRLLRGEANSLLSDVGAVIFLTYKPRGRATLENVLTKGPALDAFLTAVGQGACCSEIGFDACFVPLLLSQTRVDARTVDACECGFFSIYIDEKMTVKPCSFANDDRFSFNLATTPMDFIWSEGFEAYRRLQLADACSSPCSNAKHCRGRCPYFDELAFCHTRKEL